MLDDYDDDDDDAFGGQGEPLYMTKTWMCVCVGLFDMQT